MSNRIANSTTLQPKKIENNTFLFDNEWTYNFCDCCSDCKLCCFAYWCLPCFICILFTDARVTFAHYFSLYYDILIIKELYKKEFICAACLPKGLGNLRAKMRGTYRIKGKLDSDTCATFWCPCCAVIQMKRELIYRGEISD